MKILRAEHLGMCFGVRDAIALAETLVSRQPLTILGDLVHNDSVLASLRERGIRIENDPGRLSTRAVLVTAHGASVRRMNGVRRSGHDLREATCPLVHVAHRAVAALVRDGYHPVIIGRRDHVEVRGLTEDLDEFDVVLEDADVARLQPRARFGVAAQTTQPIERVRRLAGLIRDYFPQSEVRLVDTVCQPTKLRQHAAEDLARRCDVVIVIGGSQSNNTRELVETCRRYCAQVWHVQGPEDVREEWLHGVETAGITAGTSTPGGTIEAVEERLRALSGAAVSLPAVPAAAAGHWP
jgi:4-hydroxy-3-methylbut-2-en-1-yl diphosphate reductase